MTIMTLAQDNITTANIKIKTTGNIYYVFYMIHRHINTFPQTEINIPLQYKNLFEQTKGNVVLEDFFDSQSTVH